MAAILNRVPYQVDVLAHDITSGKRIGNTFYLRNDTQTVAPPAYGAIIAGSGSTATLLANFQAAWEALVAVCLSTKYKLTSYTMRSIVGYGYPTPVLPINALAVDPVTTKISTATPHGLFTGDIVQISGVTTPPGVNGTWSIEKLSDIQIGIAVATAGPWAGPGQIQHASGAPTFKYGSKEVIYSSALGTVALDALPIYADVDVVRVNPGVGKSFRSRFAMAPIGESDNDFGKLTTAAIATWGTALSTFNAAIVNGGTDATSGNSYHCALSKKLMSLASQPFTSSDTFMQFVSAMTAHTRLGSQIQRKPAVSGL